MLESIEIRKVQNGYILSVNDDETGQSEYIYDTERKLLKAIRLQLNMTQSDSGDTE